MSGWLVEWSLAQRMTCYETLTIREAPPSPPPADFHMAHHLVKWWRNKFRNGYKKFYMGAESERTDTEELVSRAGAASQCSAPPDLLPSEARALLQPAPAPPAPPPPPAPRLRCEELTCDVQVEATPRQQPLQFSFTLYDLDGHGRMTKDDIAGIVSTIYESIGKSVTVPHYGSKTIQVRLTIVPDTAERDEPRREARRRARRRKEAATRQDQGEGSDDERRSRLSADEESSCSGEQKERKERKPAHAQPARHKRREAAERRASKKRSGSLQRKELLQIIKNNMEKNHLNFQTSRKPQEKPIREEESPPKQPHRHRNRAFTVSAKPSAETKSKPERAPPGGYLDLAAHGTEPSLCRYDRYLHAVICSSVKHAHSGFHHNDLPTTPPVAAPHSPHSPHSPHKHKAKTHHRSRSHDVPPRAAHEPRVLQIIFL